MNRLIYIGILSVILFFSVAGGRAAPDNPPEIRADTRCPVCGMFVSKYPHWLAQIITGDTDLKAFDGVKDMMAYYFSPETFGGTPLPGTAVLLVKDYYTQEWIDAKKALYVTGSDVLGPMGHELIPFSSRAAAENFMADHKGKEFLEFSDITPRIITELRQGHMMKGHSSKAEHSKAKQ